MTETAIFEDAIKTTAERIMREIPQSGEITSWELKAKLHLQSSVMYLSLGRLLSGGKITVIPDQLNYRIKRLS
ncbi:MAG: hypothetical protein NTW04_06315 [Elusimicrobia bacterium]|nr:hypothetical protein [Elusimicrobiota bacterium]